MKFKFLRRKKVQNQPILEDIKITPKNNPNLDNQLKHGYIITEDKIENEISNMDNQEKA